jgi:hypothetical protein
MGEFRDIDIQLDLKAHSRILSKPVRSDLNSVRFEANKIIQSYIERCQVQGWRTEGPTDFLSLLQDSRLTYKTAYIPGTTRFMSARVTFYRESSLPGSGISIPLSLAVPTPVKRSGIPLWLVILIVVAAVGLYAVITQVIFKL